MSELVTSPKWYAMTALLAGERGPDWAFELAVWLRDTVAQPLPALGRGGALCPFVPRALELSSLFACDGRTADGWTGGVPDLVRAVQSARGCFDAKFPLTGEADNLKAVMVAFPGMRPDDWPRLKVVRAIVKPDFIALGFTCSEFYSNNDDRSVHNPDVPIARSPIPCIIIRRLQTHDRIFLRSQPALYPIYLRHVKERQDNG
ncbi:MAG: DUF6875 domain-containing protein [Acetobacteraceae bacterium]